MSPQPRAKADSCPRFPRVSGDEPTYLENGRTYRVFSPRERG